MLEVRLSNSSTTARVEIQRPADPMSKVRTRDEKRYDSLKRKVVDLGPIRRGTLLKRMMPCGKPGCRCQADPPQLHGPYFQWTRKVNGTTRTQRVSEPEAKLLAKWIENGRKLNRIIEQMETVSHHVTERVLKEGNEQR